eukprot:1172651-Prorocentrum_minimum.AAC.2
MSDPLTKEMREKLVATAGPILGYLPENTYVMHCSPAQVAEMAAFEGVARVSHMKPEYKISPTVYDVPKSKKDPRSAKIAKSAAKDAAE